MGALKTPLWVCNAVCRRTHCQELSERMSANQTNMPGARHAKGRATARSARIPFFDNFKGILIILVVLGHFLSGATGAGVLPAWRLFDFVYLFHMPLFIFASGLFCKSVYVPERGLRVGTILYYLLLCWAMYAALWIPQAAFSVAEPFNLLTVDSSMPWYLMALAVYCALTPVFYELRPPYAIGIAFAISLLCGLVDVGNVFSVSRVITFLPFFLLGYYLQPWVILDFVNSFRERPLMPRAVAILVIAAIFTVFQFLDVDQLKASQIIFTGRDPYDAAMLAEGNEGAIMGCIIRMAGFAGTGAIGVALVLLVPKCEVPLLTRTGRHTLQVYIFHAFVSYAIAFVGIAPALYESMSSTVATAVIVALSVATAFVLGYPNTVQRQFDRLKRMLDGRLSPVCPNRQDR